MYNFIQMYRELAYNMDIPHSFFMRILRKRLIFRERNKFKFEVKIHIIAHTILLKRTNAI